jgi:hypothetical protein
MAESKTSKKELTDIIYSYHTASKIIQELRDEDIITAHDCDNILGHLNSGMIEDILLYVRSYMTRAPDSAVLKTMEDYVGVKRVLERQNMKPEDVKEILGLFFKNNG